MKAKIKQSVVIEMSRSQAEMLMDVCDNITGGYNGTRLSFDHEFFKHQQDKLRKTIDRLSNALEETLGGTKE